MVGNITDIGTPASLSSPQRLIERYKEWMETAEPNLTALVIIGVDAGGNLYSNNCGVTRKDLLWALANMQQEMLQREE